MNETFMMKYFYLFCSIFWLILSYKEQRKVKSFISKNPGDSKEAKVVSRWIVPSISAPLFLLFIFNFFDGNYLFDEVQEVNIFVILSKCTTVVFSILLFYWIMFKNGAQVVEKLELFQIKSQVIAKIISIGIFGITVYGIIKFVVTGL